MSSPRPAIPLRSERVKALLGVEVSEHRIAEILQGFGCSKAEAGWVPNHRRTDLTREVDLIEEIGRVLGMEAIPPRVQGRFAPVNATDRAYDRAMVLRHACVGSGLHETRSITLVPAHPIGFEYINHGDGNLLRLKNPMIDDQVVLRPNLLSGLLTAVGSNVRAGAGSVRLFEIGRVFLGQGGEERHLAIILGGPVTERCVATSAEPGRGFVSSQRNRRGIARQRNRLRSAIDFSTRPRTHCDSPWNAGRLRGPALAGGSAPNSTLRGRSCLRKLISGRSIKRRRKSRNATAKCRAFRRSRAI